MMTDLQPFHGRRVAIEMPNGNLFSGIAEFSRHQLLGEVLVIRSVGSEDVDVLISQEKWRGRIERNTGQDGQDYEFLFIAHQ